ncbi:hypothetical protein [Actinoplanes couchii]|uniref:Uncharacterized protein n=1 Tax=Actinoplanes couchii TaxID=403638 RepID=A0ABQ3XMV4_9ACTN|nr:hypothetical protein [Actinoplanes couchii]MDR6317857.1 hypothetical protein [Actinoplanes couchii]GID59844.1 hypothetical protein Aco03nite_082480 [Actinoplanes couchii]
MTDVRWADVARHFADDGSLVDVYVFDVGIAGWQLVLDVIRAAGWPHVYHDGDERQPLPDRVEEVFERRGEWSPVLHIRPAPGMVVTTLFFGPDDIEFDLDPGDVRDQETWDALCCFLRTVGRKLHRQVVLTPESTPEIPLIVYSPAGDRVTAAAFPDTSTMLR